MTRWMRPEAYPLSAAVGFAVWMCGFQLVRNVYTNPDVRVSKSGRTSGVINDHEEGRRYAEHGLRKFLRNRNLKSSQQLTLSSPVLIQSEGFQPRAAQNGE
ncbi:B12d protein [Musa troglodytarum]|uniref:B12d protein n=1 Tax=Musa troglodytarum TaxID=320322 RepID=A0A9E7FP32_9LILI|nr:B12d protein [Musa troglodytarum]